MYVCYIYISMPSDPSRLQRPTDLAGDGKDAGTQQRHLQHLRDKLLDAHLAVILAAHGRAKKQKKEPQK